MTFRDVMKALGIWNKAQRDTYRELAGMNDKQLRDIGINRCDVMRLIAEAGEDKNDG